MYWRFPWAKSRPQYQAGTGHLFSFSSSASTTQGVNVVCDANIVLAVAERSIRYSTPTSTIDTSWSLRGNGMVRDTQQAVAAQQSGPGALEVTEL